MYSSNEWTNDYNDEKMKANIHSVDSYAVNPYSFIFNYLSPHKFVIIRSFVGNAPVFALGQKKSRAFTAPGFNTLVAS
jgi:hypothetical protein